MPIVTSARTWQVSTIPGQQGNKSICHTARPALHWLQEAEAQMFHNIYSSYYVHLPQNHRQMQSKGADGRSDRYAQLLEPKIWGHRPGGWALPFCLHWSLPRRASSDSILPPSGAGDTRSRWVSYCHTMHCFSDLGVWPPFSLTCISLNQGLVNDSFFLVVMAKVELFCPKACVRNCENGRVFS